MKPVRWRSDDPALRGLVRRRRRTRDGAEQLWGLSMMADTEAGLEAGRGVPNEEAELRASYQTVGPGVETPVETGAEKAYAEFLELRQKLGTELMIGDRWRSSAVCGSPGRGYHRADGVKHLYGGRGRAFTASLGMTSLSAERVTTTLEEATQRHV